MHTAFSPARGAAAPRPPARATPRACCGVRTQACPSGRLCSTLAASRWPILLALGYARGPGGRSLVLAVRLLDELQAAQARERALLQQQAVALADQLAALRQELAACRSQAAACQHELEAARPLLPGGPPPRAAEASPPAATPPKRTEASGRWALACLALALMLWL